MADESVVAFTMGDRGHFTRVCAVVGGLVSRGVPVTVFTAAEFADDVAAVGADFRDIFAARPLAAADDESVPFPSRYVTFAAHFADEITSEAAELQPAMVLSDVFAVIGQVVAKRLGLPRVNLCSGHDLHPERFARQMESEKRVAVSARCHAAVEVLREREGIRDASWLSYVTAFSPDLNIYGEPETYISADTRALFEPVAFFGSLPEVATIDRLVRGPGPQVFNPDPTLFKVYVSLGTAIWRYYTPQALAALDAIASYMSSQPDWRAVISLGDAPVDDATLTVLERPGVSVHRYVNQWRALDEADVFITHNGLNSTHEAIYSGVPMISYPMLGDQPWLAALCARLGIAIPFETPERGPLDEGIIGAAFDKARHDSAKMRAALVPARQHELDVLAGRPAVIDRIIDIMTR